VWPRTLPEVVAVSARKAHRLAKDAQLSIRLIAGEGVAGDAHCGVTVKHRSRVAKDPTTPNLRQVHLIHSELFAELTAKGFAVAPGALGENITTSGVDLLALGAGTRLRLGAAAVIEITGLRNPCVQLNGHSPGLMNALIDHAPDGSLVRKCGVMAIVITGGDVRAGDTIAVEEPAGPFEALGPV
jgi:MOSC domain-containing protein YiiM